MRFPVAGRRVRRPRLPGSGEALPDRFVLFTKWGDAFILEIVMYYHSIPRRDIT
jgi:hypothetical protein